MDKAFFEIRNGEMLFISAVFCSVNFSVPNLNKVV